ncbi:putative tectonic-2-like [Homarus americanus]|uniref:Putative tectonic-2-like n=1 Tax=Homarus americanus TaxID=6706 RepID=A0A8J5KA64_HOMAM|nr:putative tectonic-2-like [Homarus americanus]
MKIIPDFTFLFVFKCTSVQQDRRMAHLQIIVQSRKRDQCLPCFMPCLFYNSTMGVGMLTVLHQFSFWGAPGSLIHQHHFAQATMGLKKIMDSIDGPSYKLNMWIRRRQFNGCDIINTFHVLSEPLSGEKILSLFYSLIRSDVVSKLGWPNITEESDFLPTILDTPENMNLLNSADCQVPFSMSYEILYQDIIDVTRNNFPVYQVIGTYVRFNYREIQFSSSFSGGSVSLTTSVTFMNHRVPSTLSRFWEGMQDRWCAGGTCWREILQPWTHPNTESDVPTTKDYYSTYIMNLIVNSALMLLVFIPLVVLTLQHSYQLNI